jgi:Ala-tRNA(Pro) deacylase
MHEGVVVCAPEAPLRYAAELMSRHRIHAVVVLGDDEEGGLWGMVSDVDLVTALARGELDARTAGGMAQTPPVTISPDDPLERAAETMAAHCVTHLIVTDRHDRPIGIVSTLDLARAVSPARPSLTVAEIMRALTQEQVGYELLPHEWTARATDEAAVLQVPLAEVAKTVVVVSPDGFVRVVVPASERLDLRKVRDALGETGMVWLASEEQLAAAYPMFELGAVPPFGGPAGERVIVDRRFMGRKFLVLEAGSHVQSLRLRTADVLRLTNATMADVCRSLSQTA